jgi:hypothetical protein
MRAFRRQAALVALVWSASAACAVTAHGGLLIATYNHGHSNTQVNVLESSDFSPLERIIDHFRGTDPIGFTYTAASTEALRVLVDLRGRNNGGVAFIGGTVVFEALPGTTATHADVTLAVNIEGFLQHNSGGAAGWNSDISFAGSGTRSVSGSVGGTGVSGFTEVDVVHSVTRTVQLGAPVSFGVSLRAGVFAPNHPSHWARADFGNSLEFNPNAFFTIYTPGVTANSVDGDWLVNNRLASANAEVPEPGSMTLLGCGIGGVCWFGRRRKNAVARRVENSE